MNCESFFTKLADFLPWYAMDKHPIQGGLEILVAASSYRKTRKKPRPDMEWSHLARLPTFPYPNCQCGTHENSIASILPKTCKNAAFVFTRKLKTSKQQRLTKKPEKPKFNSGI